jgi:hypothetical protein
LLTVDDALLSPDEVIHDLHFPPIKAFTVVFEEANCLAAAIAGLTLVFAIDLRRGD